MVWAWRMGWAAATKSLPPFAVPTVRSPALHLETPSEADIHSYYGTRTHTRFANPVATREALFFQ